MEDIFIKFERGDYNATHIAGLTLADFTEQYKDKFFMGQPEGTVTEKLQMVWDSCRKAVEVVGNEAVTVTPTPAPKVEENAKPKGKSKTE